MTNSTATPPTSSMYAANGGGLGAPVAVSAPPSVAQALAFQPSAQQQMQQARVHAANLALQSAQRRDLAAHAAASGATNIANASKLQQRAAAAAQVLGAERKLSPRDVQAMLEKNEAALRMWNALYRQQPPVHQMKEHKEWLRKCYLFRQQIGARLEVLASLADKQIAQEDAKPKGGAPQSVAAPQAHSRPNVPSAASITSSGFNAPANPSIAIPANAVNAASTAFPVTSMSVTGAAVNTQPIGSFAQAPSVNSSSLSTGVLNQNSVSTTTATPPRTSVPPANLPARSVQMSVAQSSGFAPTSFNPSSTASTSSYMAQAPNYMINPATMAMNVMAPPTSGMMNQQQFMMMPIQMQMNMANQAGMYNPAMFPPNNFGMMNAGNNPLPMDPFNASLAGFGQQQQPIGFPMQPGMNGGTSFGMTNVSAAPNMMNPMNGGFQNPAMMVNNFQFNAMANPASQPVQQGYQGNPTTSAPMFPAQQRPQQQPQTQNPPQPSTSSVIDNALFDDADVNLFDGFSEDAFLPLQ